MSGALAHQGKVAIVTGSSRGIGLATAWLLAAQGARIVLTGHDAAEVEAAEAALRDAGHDVASVAGDVTDPALLQALIDTAEQRFGGIDLLVCNAGITGIAGPEHAFDLADHDRVMAVNLRSMVALAGLALPRIAARGGGAVVLMASISASRGNGAINAYALAKAGIVQFARNLAVQWGPRGVRVNTVSPGFIATELSRPLLDNAAFMTRRMAMTPLRRPGTAEDIAGAVSFLLSPAAGFVTGHDLVVDGGTLVTDGS